MKAEDCNVKINRKYLKYAWKWKIKEETCLICQQDFNSSCSSCSHPIECVPASGVCCHIFHYHCIKEWILKNTLCPICRNKWSYKKIYKENL